jgi:predicted nucleotide-binding protein
LAEEFSVFDNVGIVSFGLSNRVETFKKDMDNRINCLESISERLPLIPQKQHKRFPTRIPERKSSSRDVFVVHGHDESARETLARFIEKLGLRAVILQEQPKGGRTIIEQLEEYSDVGFAIVLMTLDDIGVSVGETEESKLRARQNVIFEFGYFLGKLERNKVRILRKGDVEIPSDLQGVLYIPMDSAGAWRMELAKEIKNAGIDVDLNKVFSP